MPPGTKTRLHSSKNLGKSKYWIARPAVISVTDESLHGRSSALPILKWSVTLSVTEWN